MGSRKPVARITELVLCRTQVKFFFVYQEVSLWENRLKKKSMKILISVIKTLGGSDGKESACSAEDPGWVGKILWRREWQPAPVFLPGESHGQEEPGGLQTMGSQRVGQD